MACAWTKKEPVAALSSVPQTQLPNPEPIPNEIESFQKEHDGGRGEKRRLNWSREEDVLLAKSYLTISDDQVINSDQKATAFWARVVSYYNAHKHKNHVHRCSNMMRSHWHNTIQKKVSRFSIIYNNIYSSHQSSHSEEEILRMAYEKYHDEQNGVAFNLEHVWRILKDRPMFAPQSPDPIVGTKKARTSESGASNISSNQDTNNDIGLNEAEDACPVGQKTKTAKRKGKNKARSDLIDTKTEYNNMITELGKLTSLKKAEVEIKKAQIELDKLKAAAAKAKYESKMEKIRIKEYEILQRDTSNMSGFQLQAHEMMCERIKANWKM